MLDAIKPLVDLRKLRRKFALQVLDFSCHRVDRSSGLGLRCIQTSIQMGEGGGILRAETLSGAHLPIFVPYRSSLHFPDSLAARHSGRTVAP